MNVCAQCGGPKVFEDPKKSPTDGSRIPLQIWRAYVEADPFCSRQCCEKHHKLAQTETRKCVQCGEDFAVPLFGRGSGAGKNAKRYCSKHCAYRAAHDRKVARIVRAPDAVRASKGHCRGCGCPHGEETPGCYACWQREYNRMYRRRRKASAAHPSRHLPATALQASVGGRESTTEEIAA